MAYKEVMWRTRRLKPLTFLVAYHLDDVALLSWKRQGLRKSPRFTGLQVLLCIIWMM